MNKKTLLTMASCTGIGATAIVSHIDTVRDGGTMKPKNWKNYLPTIGTVGLSMASVLLLHRVSLKELRALTEALTASGGLFYDYTNKVKEVYGEEAHNDILDQIAKDRERGTALSSDVTVTTPGFISCDCADIPAGDHLFYDIFNNFYFRANPQAVWAARYFLNRNLAVRGEVTIGQFYGFLGVDIDGIIEPNIGWGDDFYSSGMVWIDADTSDKIDIDGEDYTILAWVFPPDEIIDA